MPKYHISSDGNPRVCRASDGNCPLGRNTPHFPGKAEARAAFEASVEFLSSSSKNKRSHFVESVRTVNELGDVEWRNTNGQLHRDGGLPAIEWANGSKMWYQNGQIHRDGDLPAVELADGTKEWYRNGKRHRDGNLPAAELADGSKFWFQNNQSHRDEDLASGEWSDDTEW